MEVITAADLVTLRGLAVMLLLSTALAFADEAGDALPDIFPKKVCRRSDNAATLGSCIRGNFQTLLPHLKAGGKLGLPSLEPYYVPQVNTMFRSVVVDFDAVLSNLTVHDMTDVIVRDARADLKNDSMTLDVDLLFPKMAFRGLFEFSNGKFATWSFKGRGPFEFTFRDIVATWRFQGKTDEGGKYMPIYYATTTYTVGGMKMWAKDLVDGYPNIDQLAIVVVNRLWAEVVRVGKPFVQKQMSEHIRTWGDSVFRTVPYNSIFPE